MTIFQRIGLGMILLIVVLIGLNLTIPYTDFTQRIIALILSIIGYILFVIL